MILTVSKLLEFSALSYNALVQILDITMMPNT